jgi:deazaflavin-dependent oxidoreductase (nitroreductase family)
MSRIADFYGRLTPHIAHRPGTARAAQAHAWVTRRTRGRLGGRLLGNEVLVLRTTGRRSGQQRDSPMFFLRHGDGFAVVASNAASQRVPAWWLNLQAKPEAEAVVRGVSYEVKARPATDAEIEQLWPEFVKIYSGYAHYKSIAKRELPVVVLEPR